MFYIGNRAREGSECTHGRSILAKYVVYVLIRLQIFVNVIYAPLILVPDCPGGLAVFLIIGIPSRLLPVNHNDPNWIGGGNDDIDPIQIRMSQLDFSAIW